MQELKGAVLEIPLCSILKKEADKIYTSIVHEICYNIITKLRDKIHNNEPYLHIIRKNGIFTLHDGQNFDENEFIVKLVVAKLKENGYTCLHRDNNTALNSQSTNDWYVCVYECETFYDCENHKYKNVNIFPY